jgi:acetyl-CoA carboxylase biotin carboxylase subunit
VMARLGDKAVARTLMAEAGLPLLPGGLAPLRSADEAARLAGEVGYPVIIKAAAGGGGRGMRVVRSHHEIRDAYEETRATAQMLFGDPRVYVERFLETARHVEIQVLADGSGQVVHLGERDCTVQRRHQKLLEETPAPQLPPGTVERMARAAVDGARAVGYVGAGTFEFLVGPDGGFSFMEVNCRIQVEHPVTEMATGVDLVQAQLRIAAGEPLALPPDAVPRGAAVECRINVEDADRDFAPTPGVLDELVLPGGPFVRVDTHGYPGYRVPAAYDSLLAKVVAWAPTRDQALDRMDRALHELRVRGPGVHTTTGFLRDVIADAEFRAGRHDTTIVDRLLADRPKRGDRAA